MIKPWIIRDKKLPRIPNIKDWTSVTFPNSN